MSGVGEKSRRLRSVPRLEGSALHIPTQMSMVKLQQCLLYLYHSTVPRKLLRLLVSFDLAKIIVCESCAWVWPRNERRMDVTL